MSDKTTLEEIKQMARDAGRMLTQVGGYWHLDKPMEMEVSNTGLVWVKRTIVGFKGGEGKYDPIYPAWTTEQDGYLLCQPIPKRVTAVIYKGKYSIVPLVDVQHVESRGDGGVVVVMKSSRYNFTHDEWDNVVQFSKEEGQDFIDAWTAFREESLGR